MTPHFRLHLTLTSLPIALAMFLLLPAYWLTIGWENVTGLMAFVFGAS